MWAIGVVTFILLNGYPPFDDHAADAVKKICARNMDLREGSAWFRISTVARDFIESLLCIDKHKRLTAQEALEHAWVRKLNLH